MHFHSGLFGYGSDECTSGTNCSRFFKYQHVNPRRKEFVQILVERMGMKLWNSENYRYYLIDRLYIMVYNKS